MIRTALVGLGKMGLSHLAILRTHPDIDVVAVCDTFGMLLNGLNKYTGLKTYNDFEEMLDKEPLDAVLIATPSRFHGAMVKQALDKNLHVFCEKPFCLDVAEGRELAGLAKTKGSSIRSDITIAFLEPSLRQSASWRPISSVRSTIFALKHMDRLFSGPKA